MTKKNQRKYLFKLWLKCKRKYKKFGYAYDPFSNPVNDPDKYEERLPLKKSSRVTSKLKETAFHETGHAIYLPKTLKCVFLSTNKKDPFNGLCKFLEKEVVYPQLVSLQIAGPVAQSLFRNKEFNLVDGRMSDNILYSAYTDIMSCFLTILDAEMKTVKTFEQALKYINVRAKKVEIFLNENWDTVSKLAQKLLDEKYITGDDVRKFLKEIQLTSS